DFPDFFSFAAAFWTDDPLHDLNGDGFINFADLFIFADYFGAKVPLFKLLAMAEEYLGLPLTPALAQNYPNPFNSSTTIPFALPADGQVRLEIFDVLGQRIRTLAAQDVQAGLHHVTWDGTDGAGRHVAGGPYFLRLSVEFDGGVPAFSAVRKLLLTE
ncbi:MAG: T9SS type A sorting domain-containing protein, partial [bacterium]|nr:T9SS type A sorting domain-containing protein [bacterium]